MALITLDYVGTDEFYSLMEMSGDNSFFAALNFDPNQAYVLKATLKTKPLFVFICDEYSKKCYNCSFIPMDDFNKRYVREVKKLFSEFLSLLDYDRIQTISRDTSLLEHWHKMMGFTKEGVLPMFMGGETYNIWGITK